MSPKVRQFAARLVWPVATTAAAVVGGTVVLLAWAFNLEAAGLGSLAFLAVLPSIALFFVLDWRWRESKAKYFGFALPMLVIAGLLLASLVDLSLGSDCDGAGQWVWAISVAVAGATAGAIFAIWLRPRWRPPSMRTLQFSLSSLFVVTTICAIFLSLIKTFDPPLGTFMFGWGVILVFLSMAIQGCEATPRRGWRSTSLLTLTAIYGPFLITAVHTWLTHHNGHCKKVWLELIWIAPGVVIEIASRAVWPVHRSIDIPPIMVVVVGGILSAMLVGLTVWLGRRTRWIRWTAFAIAALFAVWGAFAADALVRA
jgi:hypothetical protein